MNGNDIDDILAIKKEKLESLLPEEADCIYAYRMYAEIKTKIKEAHVHMFLLGYRAASNWFETELVEFCGRSWLSLIAAKILATICRNIWNEARRPINSWKLYWIKLFQPIVHLASGLPRQLAYGCSYRGMVPSKAFFRSFKDAWESCTANLEYISFWLNKKVWKKGNGKSPKHQTVKNERSDMKRVRWAKMSGSSKWWWSWAKRHRNHKSPRGDGTRSWSLSRLSCLSEHLFRGGEEKARNAFSEIFRAVYKRCEEARDFCTYCLVENPSKYDGNVSKNIANWAKRQ